MCTPNAIFFKKLSHLEVWSIDDLWEVLHGLFKEHIIGPIKFKMPPIVTMAVSLTISEIFSVKEWPDLEIWVWGPSGSLKVARFYRPYMTFY